MEENEKYNLLIVKLHDSLEGELENYKKSILDLPKEDIINKAYELTFKKELVYSVTDIASSLDTKEIKSLLDRSLTKQNVLDECYDEWLDFDTPAISDALYESTSSRISSMLSKQKSNEEEM